MTGTSLGPHRVLDKLGEGGMGAPGTPVKPIDVAALPVSKAGTMSARPAAEPASRR